MNMYFCETFVALVGFPEKWILRWVFGVSFITESSQDTSKDSGQRMEQKEKLNCDAAVQVFSN